MARGHVFGEVHAFEAGPVGGFASERGDRERADGVVGDDAVRHAVLADQARQAAGVDAGEAHDVVALQPDVEVLGVAIVRRVGDEGFDDQAAGGGGDGLDVFGVGAGVADMGKGEADDLGGVRGVGQDFLIARHRGVEADFADRVAGGAEALAFENGAVGEHKRARDSSPRGGRAHFAGACGSFGHAGS